MSATDKLKTYQSKRDFTKTAEPSGTRTAKRKAKALSFVVQKHDATRLHYDFRLELEGTLKSWAVPKGPSLDPTEKRLAMHVEDHPIEYGAFEGIIPKGEYGGGTVALWDRGTWRPEGDPHKEYRAGNLKFSLEGEKLRGSWALVRIRGEAAEEGHQGGPVHGHEAGVGHRPGPDPGEPARGRDGHRATGGDRVHHHPRSVLAGHAGQHRVVVGHVGLLVRRRGFGLPRGGRDDPGREQRQVAEQRRDLRGRARVHLLERPFAGVEPLPGHRLR